MADFTFIWNTCQLNKNIFRALWSWKVGLKTGFDAHFRMWKNTEESGFDTQFFNEFTFQVPNSNLCTVWAQLFFCCNKYCMHLFLPLYGKHVTYIKYFQSAFELKSSSQNWIWRSFSDVEKHWRIRFWHSIFQSVHISSSKF